MDGSGERLGKMPDAATYVTTASLADDRKIERISSELVPRDVEQVFESEPPCALQSHSAGVVSHVPLRSLYLRCASVGSN